MARKQLVKRERALALPGFSLTRTGLVAIGNPSFAQWEAAGAYLERAEGAVQWWIGDWLNFGEGRPQWGDKYEQAIGMFNREYDTLAHYKAVAKAFEFRFRILNLSWMHHRALAYEPPEVQAELLAAAEPETPGGAPRLSVSDIRQELRSRRRAKVIEQISAGDMGTLGTFSLLYADPPWQYDFSPTETRAIENQYQTMPVEDICALPVAEIARKDSVLFMWATNPKLREALAVLDAWGFAYKTNAVWVKHAIGMGYYFRQKHELLLVATKGGFPTPEPDSRPASVIESKRTAHSQKPVEAYEALDRMYPELANERNRVELFQRRPRTGWSAWGNEVHA